ncbi:GNAT family N-acetyltransferase [Candidatus Micrarchaeota archaeon]|nr:GNAT family N-acetyltransferase [Candidatus Micrarchaeota archaeon]
MSTLVREARRQDWPEIRNMMAELHRFEIRHDPRFLTDSKTKDVLCKWIRKGTSKGNGIVLIAEVGEKPVGFAAGWIEFRNRHLYKERKIGRFWELFVKEGHRKNGIGRALSKEILKFFRKRKVRFVNVETHTNNLASKALYHSLGFRETIVELVADLKK